MLPRKEGGKAEKGATRGEEGREDLITDLANGGLRTSDPNVVE